MTKTMLISHDVSGTNILDSDDNDNDNSNSIRDFTKSIIECLLSPPHHITFISLSLQTRRCIYGNADL